MKKSLCLMVSAMALTLAACSNDSDVNEIDEACENITCGDHGTCLPGSDASAVCLCDSGYHLDPFDNTTCIADEAYPCAQIDCGGTGRCFITVDNTAACQCNPGYHTAENDPVSCVKDDEADPCDGVTCSEHGTCTPDAEGNAVCICDTGYVNASATECEIALTDLDGNHMLDMFDTAPDHGKSCVTEHDKACSTGFCDSFMGYKCSTKCTDDSQCISSDYFCRSDGRCAPKVFESVWKVGSDNSTLNFPGGSGTCDYTIDWGDGSTDSYTSCEDYRSHTYTSAGTYTIKVTGTIHNWSCNKTVPAHFDSYFCDKYCTENEDEKYYDLCFDFCKDVSYSICGNNAELVGIVDTLPALIGIESFGPVGLTSHSFENANQLTYVSSKDIPNANALTNMSEMFANATLFNGAIGNWDTSQTIDMSNMFMGASNFNQSLSGWDTSNVTRMSYMFYNAKSFNGDISAWDTSNVKYMSSMFMGASSFNQSLNGWDTSNVNDMVRMFYNASAFNGDINAWDTSNVNDMEYMFCRASKFNQPINDWNTSNVKDMSFMFSSAKNFNQPLNKWNTSNVERMTNMFAGATAFNQSLNDWNTAKVTSMSGMFLNASSFNQSLSDWDVSNVTNMTDMFKKATSFNGELDWKSKVSKVKDMSSMFNGATAFEGKGLSNWSTSTELENISYMFTDAQNFNADLTNWTVTGVIKYTDAFKNSGLTSANYTNMVNHNSGWANMNKTTLGAP